MNSNDHFKDINVIRNDYQDLNVNNINFKKFLITKKKVFIAYLILVFHFWVIIILASVGVNNYLQPELNKINEVLIQFNHLYSDFYTLYDNFNKFNCIVNHSCAFNPLHDICMMCI